MQSTTNYTHTKLNTYMFSPLLYYILYEYLFFVFLEVVCSEGEMLDDPLFCHKLWMCSDTGTWVQYYCNGAGFRVVPFNPYTMSCDSQYTCPGRCSCVCVCSYIYKARRGRRKRRKYREKDRARGRERDRPIILQRYRHTHTERDRVGEEHRAIKDIPQQRKYNNSTSLAPLSLSLFLTSRRAV